MARKSILTMIAILATTPAFANNTQIPAGQFATAQPPQALRLMNDTEFATFLQHLDGDLLRSELQMKKMDLRSLKLDAQETEELGRTYERCLDAIEGTRDEIQKLSQKQTLKLDLFLLIDLHQLARNLDLLDASLVNSATANPTAGVQKTLGYAHEVLNIDASLSTGISTFQHHFVAFTDVVDATLDQADPDGPQPQSQK
jgi:hypothetical protein